MHKFLFHTAVESDASSKPLKGSMFDVVEKMMVAELTPRCVFTLMSVIGHSDSCKNHVRKTGTKKTPVKFERQLQRFCDKERAQQKIL